MERFLNEINKLSDLIGKIPHKVGVEARIFYISRFIVKGWGRDGDWKPSRNNTSTLIKTARLKNSIRIIKVSPKAVVIGTDVPYAKIHNEGGRLRITQRVRSHTRKGRSVRGFSRNMNFVMPKRQFMGQHDLLENKIKYMIYSEIKNIIK